MHRYLPSNVSTGCSKSKVDFSTGQNWVRETTTIVSSWDGWQLPLVYTTTTTHIHVDTQYYDSTNPCWYTLPWLHTPMLFYITMTTHIHAGMQASLRMAGTQVHACSTHTLGNLSSFVSSVGLLECQPMEALGWGLTTVTPFDWSQKSGTNTLVQIIHIT